MGEAEGLGGEKKGLLWEAGGEGGGCAGELEALRGADGKEKGELCTGGEGQQTGEVGVAGGEGELEGF